MAAIIRSTIAATVTPTATAVLEDMAGVSVGSVEQYAQFLQCTDAKEQEEFQLCSGLAFIIIMPLTIVNERQALSCSQPVHIPLHS